MTNRNEIINSMFEQGWMMLPNSSDNTIKFRFYCCIKIFKIFATQLAQQLNFETSFPKVIAANLIPSPNVK